MTYYNIGLFFDGGMIVINVALYNKELEILRITKEKFENNEFHCVQSAAIHELFFENKTNLKPDFSAIVSVDKLEQTKRLLLFLTTIVSSMKSGNEYEVSSHYSTMTKQQVINRITELENLISIEVKKASINPNYDITGNNKENSLNIYGNVTGLQIQQGNNNKMQVSYDNTNLNHEKVQVLLQQLKSYKDQFPKEFGEKNSELICAIEDAQAALNSGNTGKLDIALTSIKNIAEGAAGSLLATGILSALSSLGG